MTQPIVTLSLTQTSVVKVAGKDRTLHRYDVLVDGEVVGSVARETVTRERRTPGRRYVNARWTALGWFYYTTDSHRRSPERSSRADAVTQVLAHAWGKPWYECREAAKAAKVVKP